MMLYRFGDYTLDTEAHTLHRTGQPVSMGPKVLHMLAYLLEHRQRVVTKPELREQLWPALSISDATIDSTLRAVRRAVGDSQQSQWCIQTLRGHGYRLLADVTVVPKPSENATTQAVEIVAPDPSLRSRSAFSPSMGEEKTSYPNETSGGLVVDPNPGASEAERRQLTVVCCALVDATGGTEQLDPEAYDEVLYAYQRICARVLRRFGGYVAHYLGDELLAYFGYPQAHDDAAQRAVYAALQIIQEVTFQPDHLRQEHGVRYTLRVGIHTGLVIVAQLGREQGHNRFAVGAVPHLAAQIQHLAPPNAVVISAATAQLVGGYFVSRELVHQPVGNTMSSVHVWQVLQASEARHRLDTAASLTPLAGRDSEMALLREHWERVQQGMGQAVVLVGEGGIGKSRLVHTLQEYLAHQSHLWLEYHCVPYHQHTVLQPLLTWFQRTLDWEPDDTSDAKLHKLECSLAQYRLPLSETVPLFASFLSLELEEGPYVPLGPPPQRQQALGAFVAILLAQAASQPVVLLVEDLHWSDPVTLDLLTVLLDQVPTAPMYLLLTARPGFQPPWRQHSCLTQLTLSSLSLPCGTDCYLDGVGQKAARRSFGTGRGKGGWQPAVSRRVDQNHARIRSAPRNA